MTESQFKAEAHVQALLKDREGHLLDRSPEELEALVEAAVTAGLETKATQFPSDNPGVGRKHDYTKARYDLLPWEALAEVVKVLEFGARKYDAENWRYVEHGRRRYYAATMRHLVAWWLGERLDPETGLHHLAHGACNVLFLLALDPDR